MILIVSSKSGKCRNRERRVVEIVRELYRHGLRPELWRASSGQELEMLATRAARSDEEMIVVAGGDGTLSTVANALITHSGKHPKTLGVLPTGTLNHFARDLGIPTDLPSAALTLATGHPINVDVGDVNGRVFLNNSSLGLYPNIVGHRESLRERLGSGKWSALAWAVVHAFSGFPTVSLRMTAKAKVVTGRTPFVFVGNNPYRMDLFQLGKRERMDSGNLGVYFANVRTRRQLLQLTAYCLIGRGQTHPQFENLAVGEAFIESIRPWLQVAVDGELLRMRSPLHYRSRPKSLRVVVGSRKNAASEPPC